MYHIRLPVSSFFLNNLMCPIQVDPAQMQAATCNPLIRKMLEGFNPGAWRRRDAGMPH
jgi:hypothetical protein